MFKHLLKNQQKYRELYDGVVSKISTAAFGVPQGQRLLTATALDGFVLYVVQDAVKAKDAWTQLVELEPTAVLIPPKDELLLYKRAQNLDSILARNAALYKILSGKSKLAVISAEAITQFFPHKQSLSNSVVTLQSSGKYSLSELQARLVKMGYKRQPLIDGAAQFSVRGDILDIFPPSTAQPVRVNFFGSSIESIKFFDVDTQKSLSSTDSVTVVSATDVFIKDPDSVVAKLTAQGKDCKINIQQLIDDVPSCDVSLGFLSFIDKSTIAEYLPDDAVVVFDEPKSIDDKIKNIFKEHNARCAALIESRDILPSATDHLVDVQQLYAMFDGFARLSLQSILISNDIVKPQNIVSFNSIAAPKYFGKYAAAVDDIRSWTLNGYSVYICTKNTDNVSQAFSDYGYSIAVGSVDRKINGGAVIVSVDIDEGFVMHDSKIVVLGAKNLAMSKPKTRVVKSKNVFYTFNSGDYVVHDVHGVGMCMGVTKLDTGYQKDYVVVKYLNDATLYVPVDQMDLLHRYSGSEATPRLNKIGGAEFDKIKQRVKASVKEMSIDLLSLYSQRQNRRGYAFDYDKQMMADFESAFSFVETQDQLKCIEEIKNDLSGGKIMDRLLCGDVGYGKTEVALRAAFVAALCGKQTAFLAPTTILTEQHYTTCLQRFKDFGVTVRCLNRFRSTAEVKDTLAKLKNGEIDILCGTHRLLSKDVVFKDLGLLILDEEQRFGVEDKEKIKNIKANVNVLTLSATPIPRTLHMSLIGVRDISTLQTPPIDRIPVETYVVEYSDNMFADAINRELMRGGQVFVLYNRVQTIDSFAYKVSQLVPNARVAVAHGQMSDDALESAISAFYQGQKDVIVCTTIIENGIDLPNANTMIIYDADRLGLNQLYQLRGRVGRSNRMAYAYFMYRQNKVISEDAYKRLNAIMEFTEFGSGFKIAMRDMEIRGAGNILGREQHGHMERVGYDMYCKLLKESVSELQGEKADNDIVVDIEIDAYVPADYMADDSQRMLLYQRAASLGNAQQRDELVAELEEVYGKLPESVKSLIYVSYLKMLAKNTGATQLNIKKNAVNLIFNDISAFKNPHLAQAAAKYSKYCKLDFATDIKIMFKRSNDTMVNAQRVEEFLLCAQG